MALSGFGLDASEHRGEQRFYCRCVPPRLPCGVNEPARKDFRRAHNPYAAVVAYDGAPFAGRREGYACGDRTRVRALCGEQFHGRPAGSVRILLVAQVVGGLHGVIMAQTCMSPIVGRCWNQRVGLYATVGDGPGLVQIQAVHAGERFDGFEILHERVVPCQTHGGDGEVERGEQYQAFGNHADDAGNRRDDRLPPCPGRDRIAEPADRMQLGPDQQDAQRHHHEGHDPQNRVDAAAQIG